MTDRTLTIVRLVKEHIDGITIEGDPEAGFERIGRCKHGDEVALADRTTDDREAGQQGFEAFSQSNTEN